MVGLGVKYISEIECGAVGVSINITQCRVLAISSDSLLLEDGGKNDISAMTMRLEHISPKQHKITEDVLNKLMEAFLLGESDK